MHTIWVVRANVVGHFDFVYVPVDCKHFASFGFAFVDDRAEQRCFSQCARTCCQDVSFVGSPCPELDCTF